MVKNRNWQNRVENAEARRAASKQRKHHQRHQKVGNRKTLVHELFACLDRLHNEKMSSKYEIHVWVDSIPSDSSPDLLLTLDEEQTNTKASRRNRSGSLGSSELLSKQKGRRRSNSMNETPSKKKVHPRSKEATPDNKHAEEMSLSPKLCRDNFFLGRCEGDVGGKKGAGCRYAHYPKRFKTLSTVIKSKDVLSLSADAVVGDASELMAFEEGGMDMVYYFSTPLFQQADEDPQPSVSDVLSDALAKRDCGIGSIVYLAINDFLLFDRYRDGVVVSEEDIEATLIGKEYRRLRSSSIASEQSDEGPTLGLETHIILPGQVLEYILTFLPDAAVASMPAVCQAWYNEIGTSSPELWRTLLQRRNWPLPEEGAEDSPATSRDAFRNSFVSHYTVVRDIEAIGLATNALVSSTRKIAEEREMVYQAFSQRRLAPQSPNGCIAVEVWSPRLILTAYSHDCTLRLFKAVDKSGDSGSPRACRELVCVSVNPYKNTKKRRCRLVGIGLDEEVIGCLCHVMADSDEHEAYILTVLSRDDFLCSADGSTSREPGGSVVADGAIQVIDVGQAVLNYILSSDVVDHRLLRLFDFLADGGDVSDIEVLVSQSISACGYGRFMCEVAISIPSLEFDEEDEDEIDATMILLDRKLVLFSASAAAIVWMGDSNPSEAALPRHEDLTMTCLRRPVGGSRSTCCLAVVSSSSPVILSANISPTGQMEGVHPIVAAEIARNEIVQDHWEFRPRHHRPAAITSTDIVAADVISREENNTATAWRSIVSFYPRFAPVDGSYSTLELEGDCEAVRMEAVREEHVLVLCRLREPLPARTNDHDQAAATEGGNEEANAPEQQIRVYAMIVHVPSRREIHRVCLLEDAEAFEASSIYDIPIFFTKNDISAATLAAGVWWKGLVMTGQDIRAVGANAHSSSSHSPDERSAKKKKKGRAKKQPKKDGFARGMSLRG